MSTLRGIIVICWLYAVGVFVATAATVEIRGSVTMLSGSTTNTVTVTNYTTNSVTNTYSNHIPYRTGMTNSTTDYDDAYYQKGSSTQPRFTILVTNPPYSATNVVLDNVTGLMWGRKWFAATYPNAIAICEGINSTSNGYGGYDDWRLPNINEILSLVCFNTQGVTSGWWNTAGTGQQSEEGDPFLDFNTMKGSVTYFRTSSDMYAGGYRTLYRFYDYTFWNNLNDATTYCVLPVRGP